MMRTTTLLAFTSLSITAAHAQIIPNGGFESWYSNVNYMEPNGWWTTNAVTWTLASVTSVEQGTPGAVGNYFLKAISRDLTTNVEVGRATCGNEMTGFPGFPFTQRPGNFDGKVQYYPQGGDAGLIYMTLTKWVPGTGRIVVGHAVYNITASIGEWEDFSIPFLYYTNDTPDSARVFIVASNTAPVDGSAIWVDDLHVSGGTGLNEAREVAGLELLPAGDGTILVRATEIIAHVSATDMSGRIALDAEVNSTQYTADLTGLSAGTYTIVVRTADGRVSARRFVK